MSMAGTKNWLIRKILAETYYSLINFSGLGYFKDNLAKIIKDHYREKKLGIITIGDSEFKDEISRYRDGRYYNPSPYITIEKLMDQLKLGPDDVFMDLGCGKGRVLFVAAAQRVKKVIGVEVRKDIFDEAVRNLKNLKSANAPVEIINGDAAECEVKDGTVFFMYNPFGQATLESAVKNIEASLKANPRKIRIVYYRGDGQNLLDKHAWLTYEGRTIDGLFRSWHN